MSAPRKIWRFAWFVIPVGLGAGTLYWVLAPGADHGRSARHRVEATSGENASRLQEVAALARDDKRRLMQVYGDWANDPASLAARKAALNSLFAESNVPRKLELVLGAIESDPTPPEEDPLWSHIVESLSAVWKGDVLTKGLDLIMVETRPRARRAVISSFAELALDRAGELTPPQRQLLTDRFIDVYRDLPASQRPEIERGLRNVAGDDQGDILIGKLDNLAINREYERNLAETQQAIAEGRSVVPPHDPNATSDYEP